MRTVVAAALQTGWTLWWVGWVAAGVIAELVALISKQHGDTLSEQVWALREMPGVFSLLMFMLSGFFLWLIYHFVFEGWR